jgi:hypothetical protein
MCKEHLEQCLRQKVLKHLLLLFSQALSMVLMVGEDESQKVLVFDKTIISLQNVYLTREIKGIQIRKEEVKISPTCR